MRQGRLGTLRLNNGPGGRHPWSAAFSLLSGRVEVSPECVEVERIGNAAARLVGLGLEARKLSIMIMTDHRRVSPRNTVMEFIHAIRRPTSPPGDYYDSGRL